MTPRGSGAPGPGNRFPDDVRRLRAEHFNADDAPLTLELVGVDVASVARRVEAARGRVAPR